MDGKIGVIAGQSGKEVTFPSVNSFFRGVSAMDVRRCKLVGERNGMNVAFEDLGAFVVQYFQDWFESAISKVIVKFCEGAGAITFVVGLDEFRKNFVQITVIENHDVISAAAGGVQEATGLVAKNPCRYGHCVGKHTMGLNVGIRRDGQRRHAVWWRNSGGGWQRFGGADVLAILA